MKNTGIQWCDDTINPTSGCDGCELWTPGVGGRCYAGNFHETRLAHSLPQLYAKDFSEVRLIPGRVIKHLRCQSLVGIDRPTKPWLNGKRRKIFVEDMGDLFSKAVPFEYIRDEVFIPAMDANGSKHDLLLLTKQPNRVVQFATWLASQGISWPENIWMGTSITSRASLGRIKHLAKVPARYKFLSLEPLIEDPKLTVAMIRGKITQMIVGGESNQGSNPGRAFHLEWCRKIIKLGQKTNTAVFVKQVGSAPYEKGKPLALKDHHGGDWSEWAADLRVRQLPFGSN